MDQTPNLGLPFIAPSQAQKHVTHNEALIALDALTQISVIDRDLSSNPTSPVDGDRYIVATGATGLWQDKDNNIAAYQDGAWGFYTPQSGWIAWVRDESTFVVFDGSVWSVTGNCDSAFNTISVNGGAADTTNRIATNGPATLLNHDGQGHQLKINKNAPSDTASIIFQSGFSGRAEFGLTGDDDWHVKVSPDGNAWHDALAANMNTGEVMLPATGLTLEPSLFLNLLSDSGRFNGSGNQHQLVSSVATAPSYLTEFNGASITFPAKFIHNNTNFGGSAGALDAAIEEIIIKVFGAGGLRYGPEFWCMNIEAGPGTGSTQTIGQDTFYRATVCATNPRPARYTSGLFLRCSSGKLALRIPNGSVSSLLRDNAAATYGTGDVVVTPGDGWVYFEAKISRALASYDQNDLTIGMTGGAVGQLCLPRVLAGWMDIGFAGEAIVPCQTIF